MRARFEGSLNVLRFNWPMYTGGAITVVVLLVAAASLPEPWGLFAAALSFVATLSLVLPIAASFWIYDRSALYRMPWLQDAKEAHILNLTAGFDESSAILKERYPDSLLVVLDFFDPQLHTEPSIARARRIHPPVPGTIQAPGTALPVPTGSFNLIVAFLSLHEIRTREDRTSMLQEIHRTLGPTGRLLITEHLRDLPNAIAFSIGVFHFHTDRTWNEAFMSAGLKLEARYRTTPFITTYSLVRA